MATSLDMSLEDIIKKSKTNNNRVRGRGGARRAQGSVGGSRGGRMAGTVRKPSFKVNVQPSRNTIAKASRRPRSFQLRHDLFEDSLRAAGKPILDSATKLYVGNLDLGVTNEDIRELFAEIGDLKRYAVHYDHNGRSSGSAEVIYRRRSDAFAALKRYNNVMLDGKPIKIEIIGSNSEVAVSARVNVIGRANGSRRRTVVMKQQVAPGGGYAAVPRGSGQRSRGGLRNHGRGNGQGQVGGRSNGNPSRGGGRGRGKGRAKPVEKSAVELDKELENYHSESMQTS